ncbi:MAG: hypothetical protein NXH72_00775 [Hyphomonadaceae bacterium]|nr:hypothetical protein [Hyphomonadaceae bacterium]
MAAKIILGPRPGKKSKDSIQAQGVTDILTLLSAREQADSIKLLAKSIGAAWHHFPVDGGHLETLAGVDLSQLFLAFDEIERASEAPVIYLHCSAGIHRTGFVIYAYLRYRGRTPDAALAELIKLRPVTSEQVGEDRIALAEQMFRDWKQR